MTPDLLRPSPRRRWRTVVSVVILVVVVAFAAVAVWRNWSAVRNDLGLLGPSDYLWAGVAALGGLVALWGAWAVVVRELGGRLSRSDSLTIHFAAQLGKYVPGSVWPAMIQARLGRRNGIAGSTMLVAYALWMAVLCAIGAAASVLVLTGDGVELPSTVVLAVVVGAVVVLPVLLHEQGLPRLINWALHRSGRATEPVRISWRGSVELTALCVGAWLAFGLHAWALARPLGADLGDLALTVGAFSLAFVVGIVAVPLPAGAGLREAVLVLTLGPTIGSAAAITVALLSRLVMVVAEVLLASLTGVPSAIRWARTDTAAGAGAQRPT